MFTVKGAVYGQPYEVTFTDARQLDGDPGVIALLTSMEGEPVTVPPVGPTYTLALDDGQSVLTALMAETTVEEVEGDYPSVTPPIEEDVVY